MAHLSCVGSTREELHAILDGMRRAGIENVLALRGDPPRGETDWTPHPGGLHYSTELASLIAADYPFSVGAACFPEVHPRRSDLAHDLRFLKEKVDSGASFLITQLFFDNELYFRFVDEARGVGIDVPILPGIMPITDVAPDQDDHRDVRGDDPAAAAGRARVARRRSRRGAPARRLLRHPPVRRAAGPRRARASTSTRSTAHRRPARSSRRCGCCSRGLRREVVRTAEMISSAWATIGRPSSS